VLGVGAVTAITGGRPLCIVDALKLLTLICGAVMDEYKNA
jgi:hypothetical protein